MKLLSKDEIMAGIKNALDRGYSLDQAIESFISAGYNPNEVEEAATAFSSSALSIAQPQESSSKANQKLSSTSKTPTQIINPNNPSNSPESLQQITPVNIAPIQPQQPLTQKQRPTVQPSQISIQKTQPPIQPQVIEKTTPITSSSSIYQNIPPKRKTHTGLIIFLIILLILLILGIAGLMIFKEQISTYLSTLSG